MQNPRQASWTVAGEAALDDGGIGGWVDVPHSVFSTSSFIRR